MASIQINQLSPLEAPMEELSYDMTDSIQGGFLRCFRNFLRDYRRAGSSVATANLLDCLFN